MTGSCQLCGTLIYANRTPKLNDPAPNTPAHEYFVRLAEFDLLAGRMSAHLLQDHQQESMQMSAVQFLAGKVYAMTWCASATTPEFDELREKWRKAVLEQLVITTAEGQAAEAGAGDSSAPAAPPPPSGS